MDAIDHRILNCLMGNARMSNAAIARQLGLAPSAVLNRIRRLEAEGVVTGYEARVDPRKLGLDMSCFVIVRSDEPPGVLEVGKKLSALPEVLEVHFMAADFCYLVKVREHNSDSHVRLVEAFGAAGVRDCQTLLILKSLKETARLPLSEPEAP